MQARLDLIKIQEPLTQEVELFSVLGVKAETWFDSRH